MHIPKKMILAIWLVLFSLIINGCTWFPNNRTRPAPVRPNSPSPTNRITTPLITPSPDRANTAPTKRIPGMSSITEKTLLSRISKIDKAAKEGNWTLANRETNTLGIEMARFSPPSAKGKALRDLANFNALYVKLQADVKTRNKTAVTQDTKKLRVAMQNFNRVS